MISHKDEAGNLLMIYEKGDAVWKAIEYPYLIETSHSDQHDTFERAHSIEGLKEVHNICHKNAYNIIRMKDERISKLNSIIAVLFATLLLLIAGAYLLLSKHHISIGELF